MGWKRTLGILSIAVAFCLPGLAWSGSSKSSQNDESGRTSPASGEPAVEESLDNLIQETLSANPGLLATRHAADALRNRVKAEETLPDPIFSFETMGDPFPFELQAGDPSSGRTYRLMQELPFPGKLGLKGKIASSEAEAQRWNYEWERSRLVSEAKQAYYDHFLVHKSLEVLEENRGLLEDLARVAQSRYEVGETSQQDLLKAHVEISRLEDRKAVLEQRRIVTRALLNNLRNRPPETPLGIPVIPESSQLPYSLEELTELALKNAPVLKMQEQEVERNQQSVDLAQREYYPDFAVSVSVTDRKDMREMYGLMVSTTVPIYFWRKQRPLLESARQELSGARHRRESVASSLHYSVKDAHTAAKTSEELLRLYKGTVIPQASLALESALASYQTGRVDFLTLVDTELTLLEYQLKYYESLTDFYKALARLEPLVGVELTR